MKGLVVVGAIAAAGCPGPQNGKSQPLADPVALDDRDLRGAMIGELRDLVLNSYERDEAPELDSAMIPPQIGQARIGVGPGDVLLALELVRIPSRWPLDVDPRIPTRARSKRLEVQLASDASAAWVFDEISWRIPMTPRAATEPCSRTAIIPLRMTALFARDGDRWVQVFEHVSFGRTPMPLGAGEPQPKQIFPGVISGDLRDELSAVLAQGLFRPNGRDPRKIANGREALMLGPDVSDEWHGADVPLARLGATTITAEERRIGTVGRSLASSSIAYWIGNFVADMPARGTIAAAKIKLRGTFVFEKRDDKWVMVQGHLSQPTMDHDLATFVFGTALVSSKPLDVTCDDGSRPTAARPASPRTPDAKPSPAPPPAR